MAFGVGALAACCATPYGWETILASRKILDLGELLHLIYEWMPMDFSGFSPFEACILALIAGALYCGVKLSPPRIVLVLGLFHMALSHVRNIEVFALLLPLVVLAPVSSQFALQATRTVKLTFPMASAVVLAVVIGVSTWAFAANHRYSPPASQSPAAAVDALLQRNPRHILNDLPFGGYLISRQIPVFIDGRAELYGEAFEMGYYRALQLKDVNLLPDMLKSYDIDAVLLTPATPAASLLDHLDGWQRVYSDASAVVHIRNRN
jgi:multisubunit Na+/H+ antiporter MnhC subunit